MSYQPISIKKGGADPLDWRFRGSSIQSWKPFNNSAAKDFQAMEKYLSATYGDFPQITFSDDSGAPAIYAEVSKAKHDRLRIRINAGQRFADLQDFDYFPYPDQLRFFQERAGDEINVKITTSDIGEALRLHKLNASETTRQDFKTELQNRMNDKNNISEILKAREGQDAQIYFND